MFHRHDNHNSLLGATILGFLAGAATWMIFGKKIKQNFKDNPEFRDIKKQVYEKASQITDLTREKYNEIIDEVSDNYSKVKGISENELQDLIEDLKTHWWRIKGAWKEY